MTNTPFTDDQKRRAYIMTAGGFAVGACFAFLLTSLILNKKYAKLEAEYWGM